MGAYTDDMRYRLMICQAILRKQGPIDGADLAAEWLNYRLMAEGAKEYQPTLSWPGPERAYARIVASLPNLAQMATTQRFCRSGWDAPLGLLYPGRAGAGRRSGLFDGGRGGEPRSLPAQRWMTVIEQVLKHAGSLGSQAGEFTGRLTRLLDIAAHCPDVYSLREPFYKHFLVSFPALGSGILARNGALRHRDVLYRQRRRTAGDHWSGQHGPRRGYDRGNRRGADGSALRRPGASRRVGREGAALNPAPDLRADGP